MLYTWRQNVLKNQKKTFRRKDKPVCFYMIIKHKCCPTNIPYDPATKCSSSNEFLILFNRKNIGILNCSIFRIFEIHFVFASLVIELCKIFVCTKDLLELLVCARKEASLTILARRANPASACLCPYPGRSALASHALNGYRFQPHDVTVN